MPSPILWLLDEATLLHRLQHEGALARGSGDLLTLQTVVLAGGEIIFARVVAESTAAVWAETLRGAIAARGDHPYPHALATDRAGVFGSLEFLNFVYLELQIDHCLRAPQTGSRIAERAVRRLQQHVDHHLGHRVEPTLERLEEDLPDLIAFLNPLPVEV